MLGMIARPYGGTISGASTSFAAQAAFPTANALLNDYGRVARSTSAPVGTVTIVVDLGSAKAVDCLGVLWHNLRAGDTIGVGAGTTPAEAAGGSGYFSGYMSAITGTSGRDVAAPSKFLVTPGATQTFRYWAFIFNTVGTVNPSGYLQLSRLFVGKKQTFQIGPQRADLTALDTNQKIQLETGEDRTSEDTLLIKPVSQLDFAYAKESEMATLLGQYVLGLGASLPMMVVPDLTAVNLQDQIVFGRPENVISLQSDTYDVWKFQARVRSFGP